MEQINSNIAEALKIIYPQLNALGTLISISWIKMEPRDRWISSGS